MPQEYEYLAFAVDTPQRLTEQLNEHAKDDWEPLLFSTLKYTGGGIDLHVILRRPKRLP